MWCSLEFARADHLFREDTEESVRSAIQLVPDGWEYYMRLAQFDHEHARNLLSTAVGLNHYNAQGDIELGLKYEADGDFAKAEKMLLAAFEVDHTYLPRWSLANYYFRRDNLPAFWKWARSAAEMPADDVGPLFELCWRVSPDPETITRAILNEKPELIRQYLGFLLAKNQLQAVAVVAVRLVRSGNPNSDRSQLFSVVNRLAAANDTAAANTLWRLLIEEHWAVAENTLPNNANFGREPLPITFDWSLPEYPGLNSWPGSSGLEIEFSGNEPEDCIVAEQGMVLSPGSYTMSYSYRTTDIPPATGIRWQIVDAKSNDVLLDSPDLSSDELKHSTVAFSVPSGASFLRLRLGYRRALGTPRISGTLVVLSTQIEAHL
jgi:tetratricopeptide (TPR) repeat protein